ncbi:hypothetical protein AAF712_010005 [Marasmius tenuissimus]|uniref:Uncharacterized protein n=1 Tax=Marasmius tenuissimus TaxID=585030 RepID=A0ABR2ZPM9_9AGAR
MLRGAVFSGSEQNIHRTLVDEVERFPTLERAVADHPMFSDPEFLANIRGFIEGVMDEDKEKGSKPAGVSRLLSQAMFYSINPDSRHNPAKGNQVKSDLDHKLNVETKPLVSLKGGGTNAQRSFQNEDSSTKRDLIMADGTNNASPPPATTSRSSPESRPVPPTSDLHSEATLTVTSEAENESKEKDVVMQDANSDGS